MRTFSLVAASATMAALLGVANAATITILSPGTTLPPLGYGNVATFDGLTAEAYGTASSFGDFVEAGASFSGTGIVMNNNGGGSLGLYATPLGDPTNYMALLGRGSETINYSGVGDVFGLYWGSADSYNSLAFYNNGDLVATLTGANLPSITANGDQTDYSSNRYVLITSLPSFNEVIMSSGANSFEFDNIVAGSLHSSDSVAAAPELSTWAMMIVGFAGLGLTGYRSARRSVSIAA